MKITKTFVEKLTAPPTGQALYRDDEMTGFGIRITANKAKSFFVEKRVNGKVKRMTLGRFPGLSVEKARKEAQKLLGKIATGIDPVAERKEQKAKMITLAEVFEDYLKARKALKPLTIKDYKASMREAFEDWKTKPLCDITKDMVAKRHSKVGERSHARSNTAMRLLRALFNFAAGEYEDAKGRSLILENPVKRLSHTKAWYRINRRQTFVKPHKLAPWYNGVITLSKSTCRDYLLLLLFTGLRRTEAATLKWSQIDLKAKTLIIEDTKNHQPHTLPLSDFLYNLLMERKKFTENEYVFPGTGKEGYIIEPRKQMEKVIALSGVSFTLHDLRRTFITIAESLDISAYAVKRLVNHKMNNDVTAGYIGNDPERLRKPMQEITNFILTHFNKK